jgi:hypothetical protein
VATVIAATEEAERMSALTYNFREEMGHLVHLYNRMPEYRLLVNETAYELSDVRLHAWVPTAFAVLSYVVALAIAFVNAAESARKEEIGSDLQ